MTIIVDVPFYYRAKVRLAGRQNALLRSVRDTAPLAFAEVPSEEAPLMVAARKTPFFSAVNIRRVGSRLLNITDYSSSVAEDRHTRATLVGNRIRPAELLSSNLAKSVLIVDWRRDWLNDVEPNLSAKPRIPHGNRNDFRMIVSANDPGLLEVLDGAREANLEVLKQRAAAVAAIDGQVFVAWSTPPVYDFDATLAQDVGPCAGTFREVSILPFNTQHAFQVPLTRPDLVERLLSRFGSGRRNRFQRATYVAPDLGGPTVHDILAAKARDAIDLAYAWMTPVSPKTDDARHAVRTACDNADAAGLVEALARWRRDEDNDLAIADHAGWIAAWESVAKHLNDDLVPDADRDALLDAFESPAP